MGLPLNNHIAGFIGSFHMNLDSSIHCMYIFFHTSLPKKTIAGHILKWYQFYHKNLIMIGNT